MEEIRKFMIDDHKKITKLLTSFKKNPSQKNLAPLKTNIKKHHSIEEKFIFKAFITANEIYDIFKLIKEHKQIQEIMNEINKKLPEDCSKEIRELTSIHLGHMEYENQFLYPKLENLLDNKYKKQLFSKIKKNR